MSSSPVTSGINVAKAHLDVALRPSGGQMQVADREGGIAGLLGWLRPLAPTLVVLAPLARDSGTLHGKRLARGGRGNVRAAPYMGHARRDPPQSRHPPCSAPIYEPLTRIDGCRYRRSA